MKEDQKMRIVKDKESFYQCKKCDSSDFWFMKKGEHLGIYCINCGRWLKWADKDEQNFYEMFNGGDPD